MFTSTRTQIGKIVKSNMHIDYVCQVYGQGEIEACPQPADFALGTFVRIALDANDPAAGSLIGVVYNTLLVNPDFGTLGPRLSQRADLEVFSPDYLAEIATLVGLIAVGWQDGEGHYRQGVPTLAAMINNEVIRLDDSALVAFHSDAAGRPFVHYVPVLLATQSAIVPPLLIHILDGLLPLFPEHQRPLALMRNNLAWRSIVEPSR